MFMEGDFVSYNKLSRIRWAGQTLDVYAIEIRRPAGLSGFAGEGLETVGFPEDVSVALQQLPNVADTDVDKLMSQARVLTVNQATDFGAAVVKEKAGVEWLRPSAGGGT